MMATLAEQPARIADSVSQFSAEFDKAMGITRPEPGGALTAPNQSRLCGAF